MRDSVSISLHNGQVHAARGYVNEIAQEIAEAKRQERFAVLERDRIPTGQLFHLDPNQVASIVQDD